MTTITFNYESVHKFENIDGLVAVRGALTQSSRLYVIWNDSTDRKAYVGTASNVQQRFGPREEALREVGFDNGTLSKAVIMVVQIKVDGVPKTPGDDGISADFDVEHLLIRTYIGKLNVSVRNIQKVGVYTNTSGGTLKWSLENNAGIVGFGGPYDFTLRNDESL